jgi:hypothetical protein
MISNKSNKVTLVETDRAGIEEIGILYTIDTAITE